MKAAAQAELEVHRRSMVGCETVPLIREAEGNLAGGAHPTGAMDIVLP